MKHLDANNKIESLLINWHYESDDEDSHEIAEIYEGCLVRAKFLYREHSEAVDLAKERQAS